MKSILVVDDSPTIRMGMQMTLERGGYLVRTASNAAEALNQMKAQAPDAVLTDLNMPNMDGVQFIRAIRLVKSMRFVPVLLLTGDTDPGQQVRAKSAGASGWLAKPINGADLLSAMKQFIRS